MVDETGSGASARALDILEAVKDPEVREGLKGALNSMGDALNETFAEAGDTAGDKLKYAGDKLKGAFATKPDEPKG